MPSAITSAAILAGATLAMAAPSKPHTKNFQAQQVHAGHYKSLSNHAMKSYTRWGNSVPAGLKKAAGQKGDATANPEQYDRSYLVPVTVGADTLHLDFDTGSADLWVFSDETPSSEATGHSIYHTSHGKKLQGYTWDISYLDESGSKGDVYADSVVIGGVTATSQAVEAATSVSSSFTKDVQNDGLVGLSFPIGNTVKPKKQSPFFDTVKSSLDKPLFTVDLKHQAPGSYDFGYIDSSKYSGDITYVDADSSTGFYTITVDSGYQTVVDTGTSLVLIPHDDAAAYYANIPSADDSQGIWIINCNDTTPDWSISIGGVSYTVPGSYIAYSPVPEDAGLGYGLCIGGLQDQQKGHNILGDVFLK